MLPDIDPKNRRALTARDCLAHQRAVLIRGRADFQFAVPGPDQPCPSAAETFHASVGELFLKGIKASEGGLDVIGEFACWFAASLRSHDLPEERMIGMTAAVIAHSHPNIFGNGIKIADQLLD